VSGYRGHAIATRPQPSPHQNGRRRRPRQVCDIGQAADRAWHSGQLSFRTDCLNGPVGCVGFGHLSLRLFDAKVQPSSEGRGSLDTFPAIGVAAARPTSALRARRRVTSAMHAPIRPWSNVMRRIGMVLCPAFRYVLRGPLGRSKPPTRTLGNSCNETSRAVRARRYLRSSLEWKLRLNRLRITT